MSLIRRHLRAWAAIWAFGQFALLGAFVSRECFDLHRSHAGESPALCDGTVPGSQCPMRGADGRPCPMHSEPLGHAAHGEAGHDGPQPGGTCSLRACDGPLGTLATLQSNPGLPPTALTLAADFSQQALIELPPLDLRPQPISFDPPPPRS